MKVKKKIMLALIFAMVLGLSGCGNSEPAINDSVAVDYAETGTESMESGTGEIKESREEAMKESDSEPTAEPIPTPTAEPTPEPTQTPASTPAPTAKPTPEPTATPTPEPHVHQYTTETVTRQATCAEAGEKQLVCECGNAKVESVPATGQHNWVEDTVVVHHEALGHVSVTETQVQVGTTTRTEYECKNCGARFNTPEEKTDHCATFVGTDRSHATCGTIAYDYSEPVYETRTETVWVVDQEAWDEVVGTGTYTCTVCGTTK